MKSLLYSDWCVTKSTIVRVLAVCLLVTIPVCLASMSDGQQAPGVFAAALLVTMSTFYVTIGLFGVDEQNEWERVRMTMPITISTFVRARYAFVIATAFAAAVLGTALGAIIQALPLASASAPVSGGVAEILAGALGVSVAVVGYISLIMPLLFKLGMAKSRVFISLPFFLCLLFTLDPVQGAANSVKDALAGMVAGLGTPMPLYLAGIALVLALLAASVAVSERLYRSREF